ncbi:MAG: hydroxyisourate hydrolase [Candidatus Solibacter usitatus]|nr:hydroxyisourate hydrolase [Candidatus Solibacter usitatus]
MARIGTHVLDTSRGLPACGVRVRLLRNGDVLNSAATNADGRTAEPLLQADTIDAGVYELHFAAGDYFRGLGVKLGDPAFLEHVVIRFGVDDPKGHYHIPLLLSPFGYTTYRGS